MAGHGLDRVPNERREDALAALRAAFGGSTRDLHLVPVTGGSSGALTYRFDYGAKPYLMRLEAARDPVRDPRRSYTCMQIAANAGVAPPVRYANPEAGVAIMDFLLQRPLSEFPGGPLALASELASLIARLQSTPLPFPPLVAFDRLIELSAARVLASGLVAHGMLDRHLEGFARIRAAYPWEAEETVSSHNDLNPSNIIFDGKRLWIIDWEIAFRNESLVDVATVAEHFAATAPLQEVLMETLRGRTFDRSLRARMVLMRQLNRLFRGCVALSLHSLQPAAGGEVRDVSSSHARPAASAPRPVHAPTAPNLRALGIRYLDDFLLGLSAPDFERALELARQG